MVAHMKRSMQSKRGRGQAVRTSLRPYLENGKSDFILAYPKTQKKKTTTRKIATSGTMTSSAKYSHVGTFGMGVFKNLTSRVITSISIFLVIGKALRKVQIRERSVLQRNPAIALTQLPRPEMLGRTPTCQIRIVHLR